jgi:hypothetical protein
MEPKVWEIVKLVYGIAIRPILKKAVERSETTLDDFGLSLLDKLFDYNKNE